MQGQEKIAQGNLQPALRVAHCFAVQTSKSNVKQINLLFALLVSA
jgi:hypothetical protein